MLCILYVYLPVLSNLSVYCKALWSTYGSKSAINAEFPENLGINQNILYLCNL